MPEITIRLYEGRTDEQKQEIVEVFTRELSRIIDREPDYISIEFNEIPWDENVPDNLRSAQSQKQGGRRREAGRYRATKSGCNRTSLVWSGRSARRCGTLSVAIPDTISALLTGYPVFFPLQICTFIRFSDCLSELQHF